MWTIIRLTIRPSRSPKSLDRISETYVIGRRETDHAERWVTEIGWPIFHPGAAATGVSEHAG